MDLAHLTPAHHRRQVIDVQSTARHDDYSAPRALDQASQHHNPLYGGRPPAGGQQPVDANSDEHIERFERVARPVKCLVERDRKRPRLASDRRGLLAVDLTIGRQYSQDNPCGPESLGRLDVVPHDGQLGFGINKIPAPGPDQHMHRNLEPSA